MSGFSYRWDVSENPAMKKGLLPALQDSVKEIGETIANYAAEFAPVDTGRLKGAIASEFTPTRHGASAEVVANTHYAAYVEYGTGIFSVHPQAPKDYIYPTKAKALRFRVFTYKPGYRTVKGETLQVKVFDPMKRRSRWVFAARIQGQVPKPFMRPAIDRTQLELETIIQRVNERHGLNRPPG